MELDWTYVGEKHAGDSEAGARMVPSRVAVDVEDQAKQKDGRFWMRPVRSSNI